MAIISWAKDCDSRDDTPWNEILQSITLLEGEAALPDETTLKAFVLEPEGGARRSGGSLWPA